MGDNPLFLILSLIFGGGTVGIIIREIFGYLTGRTKAETERQAAELASEETYRERAAKAERSTRMLAEAYAEHRTQCVREHFDAAGQAITRSDLNEWPTY